MKAQGAWIQGVLALLGLGAAWATWQREPEKAQTGDVVVLDATKKDVTLVRFADDKSWVELSRTGEGAWLKLSAKPDAKTPERVLRGNDASERLLDSFAPLRATRALGVFDEAKLKEFGLAPPDAHDGGAPPAFHKRTIEVTARGDKRVFGAGTPPGGYTTYLRDERDGRVYVVGGTLVSDLESAPTRMVERTLHGFKLGDFDEVKVESAGKKRDLVVLHPEQPANTKFASKANPDRTDDTAKNWHSRIFALYPTDVLGKGEVPAAGAPEIKLKLTWRSKGQDKGWLEVGKVQPPTPPAPAPAADGKTPAPPTTPAAEYYARTERTAGWVKLNASAEDLLKDGEHIAAAE